MTVNGSHDTAFHVVADIPPPPKRNKRNSMYPFAEMEPGHSFFVAGTSVEVERVRFAASQWKLRHPGFDYTTRRASEGGVQGVRVWRLS